MTGKDAPHILSQTAHFVMYLPGKGEQIFPVLLLCFALRQHCEL